MDNAMFVDFPQIFPLNSELSEFDGFLPVKGENIRVRLSVKNNRLKLNTNWRESQSFKLPEMFLQNKVILSLSDVNNVLHELRSELETQVRNEGLHSADNLLLPSHLSVLFDQIYNLDSGIIQSISNDMKQLNFSIMDSKNRNHILQIKLTDKFPDKDMELNYCLPQEFKYSWTNESTLGDLVSAFKRELDNLQSFWDCTDQIDRDYCVLEPENPTRKDRSRRIALNKNVSIRFTIDPMKTFSLPEYLLMGPQNEIEKMNELLQTNMHLWDENISVVENFSSILWIDIPNKKASNKEDILPECAICYSYLLGKEIPTESCSCNQIFHKSCLVEWLTSATNKHNKFRLYSGECPYCGKNISVKNND